MIIPMFVAILALHALKPSEPMQRCGIETRAWCLRSGAYKINMSGTEALRTWIVTPTEPVAQISINETPNCDGIPEDSTEEKISESTKTIGIQRVSEIVYEVPKYHCKISISWRDTEENYRFSRRYVFSVIWLGVLEKRPLYYIINEQ